MNKYLSLYNFKKVIIFTNIFYSAFGKNKEKVVHKNVSQGCNLINFRKAGRKDVKRRRRTYVLDKNILCIAFKYKTHKKCFLSNIKKIKFSVNDLNQFKNTENTILNI